MQLLIHTGGTIGMVPGPLGLIPGTGVVEAAVAGRARVTAFDPLLDSADVGFAEWNRLLDLIEEENGPVIITHGTDTMTWTGAALTRALTGWPHPVTLTGAMQPLGAGGDAEANLELALSARPQAGVWLAFAGRLLAAGNLVKSQSHAADAFRAVALTPEATARTADATDPQPCRPQRFRARQIAALTISPGLSPGALGAALAPLDAAVLRVFGTGTIPSSPQLTEVLAQAIGRGMRIRAVSACENGGLAPGTYAAGQGLWQAGVENGGAETVEAALTRLWLDV